MLEKHYTSDAITLKSYDLNDADKIVVMYSKEKGLIKSVAKGVKRPKSKLGSRLDLLMANSLQLSKGRSMDIICQAQTINNFKNIRDDILKLLISSYLSEIVANYGMENDPSSVEIYNILYDAIETISEAQTKIEILVVAIKFQLKIMYHIGIMPEFSSCLCCKKKLLNEKLYFSIEKGGIYCKECVTHIASFIEMPYKIRDFLISMLNSNFMEHNVYEEKVTEKVCLVCFNLLKKYITTYSTKKFKSVKILASIL
jgi:DNA repair protein RecO (recombination protein O)